MSVVDFFELGISIINQRDETSLTDVRRLKVNFGISALVCSIVWIDWITTCNILIKNLSSICTFIIIFYVPLLVSMELCHKAICFPLNTFPRNRLHEKWLASIVSLDTDHVSTVIEHFLWLLLFIISIARNTLTLL